MYSQLTRHSVWLFIARLGTHLSMAVFTIVLARLLKAEAFGEYTFMAALIVVGNLVTTFGTDMLLIREIAEQQKLDSLPDALGIQLYLSGLFSSGIILTSQFFSFQSAEGLIAVRIYSLALFPLAFFTVFTTALRGMQKMGAYAGLNLTMAVFQVTAVAVLVILMGSLVLLAWLLLLVQVLAACIAGLLCTYTIPDFWKGWKLNFCTPILLAKASKDMAMFSIVGILYQRLALTLLPLLAGSVQTGLFSAAARVVEMAKVGHIAIYTALYPMMARSKTTGRYWLELFRIPLWILLVFAFLAALALFFFASRITNFLFGETYNQAIPLLRTLAWGLVPYSVNNYSVLALLADGRESFVTIILTLSLVVLVGMMIGWQEGGAIGIARAIIVAEIFQCLMFIIYIIRTPILYSMFRGTNEFPRLSRKT